MMSIEHHGTPTFLAVAIRDGFRAFFRPKLSEDIKVPRDQESLAGTSAKWFVRYPDGYFYSGLVIELSVATVLFLALVSVSLLITETSAWATAKGGLSAGVKAQIIGLTGLISTGIVAIDLLLFAIFTWKLTLAAVRKRPKNFQNEHRDIAN